MRAILTDETAVVYHSTEDQSISIATIHKGEEMDLGKVIRIKGKGNFSFLSTKPAKVWVEIKLSGGQVGYISGETKIYAIRKGQVSANSADLVEAPVKEAVVIKTLPRGATVTIVGVERNDDGAWFKATDETGITGYLSNSAKLKAVPEFTKASATKNMITGLVFVVIGVALTFMNSQAAQGNGMVYISYAVIFFGLLQGGQGVVEYLRARKTTNTQQK